jgi:hypothetical protein
MAESITNCRKGEPDHAKNEDTQSHRQAVQDHGQGEAAQAEDATQPPSPQEIETGPPLV